MAAIHQVLHIPATGDSLEFIETAASSQGACVKTRATFRRGGLRVTRHIHLHQDECFEVESGQLTYRVGDKHGVAGPGETVMMPRQVPHEHYNAGDTDLVVIQTVTPALDFDLFLDTAYGKAGEGMPFFGPGAILQGFLTMSSMKSQIVVAALPASLQLLIARVMTPVARRLGFRAVYRRFSDVEW